MYESCTGLKPVQGITPKAFAKLNDEGGYRDENYRSNIIKRPKATLAEASPYINV